MTMQCLAVAPATLTAVSALACFPVECEQLCYWLTAKSNVMKMNCGRRSRAKEMKALADIKPDESPLLAAQVVHPLLLATLIATGPPHRLHHEGGVRDGDPAARHSRLLSRVTTNLAKPVKVMALAIVFLC